MTAAACRGTHSNNFGIIMAKLFRFVFLALCLFVSVAKTPAASFITSVITITNNPNDGDTLTVNAVTRTWKTSVATPATQILIGANTNVSATNLYQQIAANPFSALILSYNSANSIKLQGSTLSNSATSTGTPWFTIVNTTGAETNATVVRVPLAALYPAERVTAEDGLIGLLNDNAGTIVIAPYATNFSNYFSLTATNIATGPTTLSNTANYITGGVLTNVTLQQVKGSLSNVTIVNPVLTNAINFGIPFSSRGSGNFSEQFGSNAVASGNFSVALGVGATATNLGSVALGESAQSYNQGGIAIGLDAIVNGDNDVVVGDFSYANGGNSTVIGGFASTVGFNQSTAVGYGATAIADHQVVLGTGAEWVYSPGYVYAFVGYSNAVFLGPTVDKGTLELLRTNVTSLANGANGDIITGTRTFLKVSGPSGSFSISGLAGGTDGRILIIENATGQNMSILNDSGVNEPTAANRIYTGTGADVAENNNPGMVTLIYDSAASRWVLVSKN